MRAGSELLERTAARAPAGAAFRIFGLFRRKPLGLVSLAWILGLIILAFSAELVAPYGYDDFDIGRRLQGPSRDHPFGTDDQGRDVLSRVLFGARTTVVVGFSALAISVSLAAAVGVASGYIGGYVDLFIQRLVFICLAFPGLIFVIFVISIFGNSPATIILTVGFFFSFSMSRVVRAAVLAVRESPFIEAARALGAGSLGIVLRHVLPNVAPVILVVASSQVGSVILLESSLAFLGFGVPPPFPSWGRMLNEAQRFMVGHPHLALFPGLAIASTVFAFNFLGDFLRDVLDPRLRGQP
jgi:peptide/nickel transport system permease protein